jgi:transcriptional regulator with GAF, ATPase, and Fis domain
MLQGIGNSCPIRPDILAGLPLIFNQGAAGGVMAENLPTKDKIISDSLNNLKELVIQFAKIGTNILLAGPRGSGKELFARLYQEGTGREEFAPTNCSGIGDSALISELFGHKKGSFTGAISDRPGLLAEYAKDGVIFLDEIGDASQSITKFSSCYLAGTSNRRLQEIRKR